MPTNADVSPHIIFPLPDTLPAKAVKNVLSPKAFQEVKDAVAELALGPGSRVPYHSSTSRWTENIQLSSETEQELLDAAKEQYNDDSLERAFIFVARYQMYEGNIPYLWTHMDQNACQHMIDLCVTKHGLDDWGLHVDGKMFAEEENQGIFMSPCQQAHGRPPYTSDNPDAYIEILFAIYTKEGHWWRDLDGTESAFKDAIEKYRWDGDIRYAEHAGHAPYFNDYPDNAPCQVYAPEECIECWTIPEDVLAEKIERNRKLNGH
jgi:hypothetical protein|tara:strand:+ start:201 stop:989 length:789 start_codon:yes stop_codon:yes gene_type:complete